MAGERDGKPGGEQLQAGQPPSAAALLEALAAAARPPATSDDFEAPPAWLKVRPGDWVHHRGRWRRVAAVDRHGQVWAEHVREDGWFWRVPFLGYGLTPATPPPEEVALFDARERANRARNRRILTEAFQARDEALERAKCERAERRAHRRRARRRRR